MNSGVCPVSLTMSQLLALIILSGKMMEMNGEERQLMVVTNRTPN
jgi:hypothetical protein